MTISVSFSSHRVSVAKSALFAALALTLAGCSTFSRDAEARLRNPAACPNVVVLGDAARIVKFDGEQTLEDVAYSGEILDVSTSCRYYGEEPILADVKVDFAFGRGPKGADSNIKMKYFVAVTRRDTDLIAKQEFTLPVKFGSRSTVELTEKINQIVIPRRDGNVAGANFEIVVGLALTKDEVRFNRSGKSLKFPSL